jgi:hypothetical protein
LHRRIYFALTIQLEGVVEGNSGQNMHAAPTRSSRTALSKSGFRESSDAQAAFDQILKAFLAFGSSGLERNSAIRLSPRQSGSKWAQRKTSLGGLRGPVLYQPEFA